MPQLTERQIPAMAEMVKRAQDQHDVFSIHPWHESSTYWLTKFREEIRPGRGHDIEAMYCDKENLVVITLDPYGSGSLSVARLDWVHNDFNEECPCSYCVAERSEYE